MSTSRHCCIYKASDNMWYLELANEEHGGVNDATTYGPFKSMEGAEAEIDNHSNPGSRWDDESGTRPPPTISPNGDPVQPPSNQRSSGFGIFRF